VPWELVDAVSFLALVPRLLTPPEQYDQAMGQPLESSTRTRRAGRWTEHTAYIEMVRDIGSSER
jgi:hypothetical protein